MYVCNMHVWVGGCMFVCVYCVVYVCMSYKLCKDINLSRTDS